MKMTMNSPTEKSVCFRLVNVLDIYLDSFAVGVAFSNGDGDGDSAIDVPRPEEERETEVSKKKDLQEQLKV